jgi:hypothetical protein
VTISSPVSERKNLFQEKKPAHVVALGLKSDIKNYMLEIDDALNIVDCSNFESAQLKLHVHYYFIISQSTFILSRISLQFHPSPTYYAGQALLPPGSCYLMSSYRLLQAQNFRERSSISTSHPSRLPLVPSSSTKLIRTTIISLYHRSGLTEDRLELEPVPRKEAG